MRIVELFGDGGQFPNGWHRYIETHIGTKWVTLLHPAKLRVIRVRKFIYEKLSKKLPDQNWDFYLRLLPATLMAKDRAGKKVAEVETNRVINWIKENHSD